MATLVDHATSQRAAQEAAVGIARGQLSGSQAELAAAKAEFQSRLDAKKKQDELIARLRAQLEDTTVPSEINVLVGEITKETITLRGIVGCIEEARKGLSDAQADADFAAARLKRAQVALNEATVALEEARAGHERRLGWRMLVVRAPLNTLHTRAANVLTNTGTTLLSDAEAKFNTIPAKIQEIARTRHETLRAELEAAADAVKTAEDQLATRAESDLGLQGKVQKSQFEFDHAERAFGDFVNTAGQRFDRAIGVLQALTAGDAVLTPQEAADAADAVLQAARESAQGEAKGIAEKQAEVDTRRLALSNAVLAAQANDPNATDLSSDPGVSAAQSALKTAKDELNTLISNFTATERATLRSWQVILPDRAWQKLFELLEAKATLTELQSPGAAGLERAMSSAEATLAGDLANAAKSEQTLAYYEDAVAKRQKSAMAFVAQSPLRLFSGVRGDAL